MLGRKAREPTAVEGALYQLAFMQVSTAIALVSSDGVFIDVNRELARLLGCSREALRGQPITAWLEPGASLAALLAPGGNPDEEHEVQLRNAQGGCLIACARASVLEGAHPEGVVVVQLRDVTKERRAEAEMRESEAHFRLLVENMRELVGVHEPDGTPLYVSGSVQDMLGYAPEMLLGQSPFNLTHPDDAPQVERARRQLLDQRAPATVSCRLRRADGSYLWCEMTGTPILDEAGEVRQIQTVARDISERVAAQAQLARSREEERLRLARELHDGPVQEMISLGYQIARLEREAADAPLAPIALNTLRQGVIEVVRQLRNVIGDLRPVELEEVDVATAIARHLAKLERQNPGMLPDVRLELTTTWEDLPEAYKICLFRVVQEGLGNAIKHAAATTVTVRFARSAEEVHLAVVDDGRGFVVPEELTGLIKKGHFGLVGAAERAGALGGTLVVRSSPGEGSELKVTLPLP